MTTLQHEYTRNGYTYRQVQRTAYAAMYIMTEGDRFVGYEVGRVKVAKDSTIAGKFIEGGERFWSDEDFGKVAFWTSDNAKAMQYFTDQHEAGMSLAERNNTPHE
jgi:hypothetical protein